MVNKHFYARNKEKLPLHKFKNDERYFRKQEVVSLYVFPHNNYLTNYNTFALNQLKLWHTFATLQHYLYFIKKTQQIINYLLLNCI